MRSFKKAFPFEGNKESREKVGKTHNVSTRTRWCPSAYIGADEVSISRASALGGPSVFRTSVNTLSSRGAACGAVAISTYVPASF